VQRKFRLTSSTDFQRVRRYGKSYAHPLLVLVVHPGQPESSSRIGVTASRGVGKAVQRNRARRLLRAAIQPLLASLAPGWELILIARQPVLEASFQHIHEALLLLLKRARVLQENHVD
jgi:ribonuclease P protein component